MVGVGRKYPVGNFLNYEIHLSSYEAILVQNIIKPQLPFILLVYPSSMDLFLKELFIWSCLSPSIYAWLNHWILLAAIYCNLFLLISTQKSMVDGVFNAPVSEALASVRVSGGTSLFTSFLHKLQLG